MVMHCSVPFHVYKENSYAGIIASVTGVSQKTGRSSTAKTNKYGAMGKGVDMIKGESYDMSSTAPGYYTNTFVYYCDAQYPKSPIYMKATGVVPPPTPERPVPELPIPDLPFPHDPPPDIPPTPERPVPELPIPDLPFPHDPPPDIPETPPPWQPEYPTPPPTPPPSGPVFPNQYKVVDRANKNGIPNATVTVVGVGTKTTNAAGFTENFFLENWKKYTISAKAANYADVTTIFYGTANSTQWIDLKSTYVPPVIAPVPPPVPPIPVPVPTPPLPPEPDPVDPWVPPEPDPVDPWGPPVTIPIEPIPKIPGPSPVPPIPPPEPPISPVPPIELPYVPPETPPKKKKEEENLLLAGSAILAGLHLLG